MGNCWSCSCRKSKVKDEEEKVKDEEEKILKKYAITDRDVEELSSTCLKYDGERCSQKWYTSSVYTDNKDTPEENFNIVCCKREARILSKLRHLNIIKFIGVYHKSKNPQPILVTEEVTSNLLCHLDKVETLQDLEKFKFSCDVSDGLAYLHSERLAHLNLCTKSILLTENLVVKIANFEYASYFSDQPMASSSSSGSTGAKFDPWGFRHDDCVFSFLPSKRYDNHSYESVDIYSFGCVVFNIFTLKQPTAEIKSQMEEISIPGIGNLVSECIHGYKKSMQEVSLAIHVCSEEHFSVSENFAQKEKVVEVNIEVHDELEKEKLDQSMSKDTDQELSEAKVNAEKIEESTAEQTAAIVPVLPQEKPEIFPQPPETPKSIVKTEDKDIQTGVQTEDEDIQTGVQTEDKDIQTGVQTEDKDIQTGVQTEDKDIQTGVQTEDKDIQTGVQTEDKDIQTGVQTEDKDVQTEDKLQTECKEIAVIPQPRDHEDEIEKLRKENLDLISRLTALEEQSFKFTNAFTTADEGSVIKLRDTYRNLQTNGRPAANRAHKRAYKEIPSPILNHTILAYEEAKNFALQEFKVVSDRLLSLFELQTPDDNSSQVNPDELKTPDNKPSQGKRDKAMMQSQQLLESFRAKPMNEKIYQILIDKYRALTKQAPDDKIPQAVDDYYSSLAKFTWDCVARPIPMILNTDAQKFDGDIHETKDGDDGDDGDDSIKGKYISYIYPVLFTSNSWPREIAMKGKVNVLDSQETMI